MEKTYIVHYEGSFCLEAESMDDAWAEAFDVIDGGEEIIDIQEDKE